MLRKNPFFWSSDQKLSRQSPRCHCHGEGVASDTSRRQTKLGRKRRKMALKNPPSEKAGEFGIIEKAATSRFLSGHNPMQSFITEHSLSGDARQHSLLYSLRAGSRLPKKSRCSARAFNRRVGGVCRAGTIRLEKSLPMQGQHLKKIPTVALDSLLELPQSLYL